MLKKVAALEDDEIGENCILDEISSTRFTPCSIQSSVYLTFTVTHGGAEKSLLYQRRTGNQGCTLYTVYIFFIANLCDKLTSGFYVQFNVQMVQNNK